MKIKTIISILSFLAIVFLWSCEKEIHLSNDLEAVPLKGKPVKPDKPDKPGNDDNEDSIFEVVLDGSVINSTKTYGTEVTNNKKFDLMHTDACGYFRIYGIGDSLVTCASHLNFCNDGLGLRQFDKRSDPGHVSFSLWILDGVNGNHNFRMFGWLQDDANTLFPETGDTVKVVFERWISSGPDGCPDVEGDFDADPADPEASVTIFRIDTPCPGDTCLDGF